MFNFARSCDPLAAVVWAYSTIRVIGCIVHNLYCIPAYCVLNLLMLPLYYISIDHYSRVENALYNWLLYVVSSWSWCGGLVVHEHGDDIYTLKKDPNVRLLVIANHQSTADVPLMMQAFTSRSEYILLWVMDAVFKWTNFGLVSQTHGDYFLNTKAYKHGALLKHCTRDYSRLKNLFVLFPEGGFRYKRQASSNSYAMKQNLPLLSNVTYPRYGGYSECIDPLVGVTHVVDLTICYDDVEHPPSIVDIVRGRRCSEVHFYYRIHSVADNPEVRTEGWLRDQWQQKDRFLAEHYASVQRLKMRNGHSARTSLNGSLRSKPSYSSMSPMTLSKEQLNMLSDNQTATCPMLPGQASPIPQLSSPCSPNTRAPSAEDLVAITNGISNGQHHQLEQVNGNMLQQGDDLIQREPTPLANGTRWSSHESVDSNFPPTPTTDELFSRQHLSPPPTAPFDRAAGRPVVLSWTKLFLVHAFYLTVVLIIYEVLVLLVL